MKDPIAPARVRSRHVEIAQRAILLPLPGRKVPQEKLRPLALSLLQPAILLTAHKQTDDNGNYERRKQNEIGHHPPFNAGMKMVSSAAGLKVRSPSAKTRCFPSPISSAARKPLAISF